MAQRIIKTRKPAVKKIIRVQKRHETLKNSLALAAVVALGAFGAFAWQRQQPVGQILRTVGVQWSAGDWKKGDALRRGLLKLEQGVAEIQLAKGAIAVVEAPASFEITGINGMRLMDGKLSANVPPSAHGFTVEAAGFSVVDHGTEFSVSVSRTADGSPESEVHVSEGEVVVKAKSKADRPLVESEALRITAASVESIPEQSDQFTGKSRLSIAEAGTTLAANPAALVHFDFDGTIKNRAIAGTGIIPVVRGCKPTEGRWPGKGALEWKSAEDRVRFTVPGELRAITLAAWVRFDSLPNLQSSLFMSESEMPGDVHWSLFDNGQLAFAVIGPDGEWHQSATPPILNEVTQGEWSFLVTTFDGSSVTHYLNGKPLLNQPMPDVLPLRPGTVELGNWGLVRGSPLLASQKTIRKLGNYIRNLNGRMEQFTLLSTSLSAQEVLDFYEQTQAPPKTPIVPSR